jgi:AAA domain
MARFYHRPALAAEMAEQLIHPGALDEGLRSGLFVSGLRRTGKTTFLIADLIPALEARGAIVIYVDLWSDVQANPSQLLRQAIQATLRELESPAAAIWSRIKKISALEVASHGLKFKFALDRLGEIDGVTLADALTQVVDQAQTDVVLIVDEVQHALSSDNGSEMLFALKAARDAINARPVTPGHFLFIGTGSHRALVNELTSRRNQAFAGATSVAYPVLNGEYVEYVLRRLADESPGRLPTLTAASRAFKLLGHRPEELMKALRLLRQDGLSDEAPADHRLEWIARTLRMSAADVEITRIEQLGGLAVAVFDRIATSKEGARGLFSAEAAAGYSKAIGREVHIEEIQPVVNTLVSENLILRKSHGVYTASDPFVPEAWQERKRLQEPP